VGQVWWAGRKRMLWGNDREESGLEQVPLAVEGGGRGSGGLRGSPQMGNVEGFQPLLLGLIRISGDNVQGRMSGKPVSVGWKESRNTLGELVSNEAIQNSLCSELGRGLGIVQDVVTVIPLIPGDLHQLAEPCYSPSTRGFAGANRQKVVALEDLPVLRRKTVEEWAPADGRLDGACATSNSPGSGRRRPAAKIGGHACDDGRNNRRMGIVVLHPYFETEKRRLGGGPSTRGRAKKNMDVRFVWAIAAWTIVVFLVPVAFHLAADRQLAVGELDSFSLFRKGEGAEALAEDVEVDSVDSTGGPVEFLGPIAPRLVRPEVGIEGVDVKASELGAVDHTRPPFLESDRGRDPAP
jgi:hypothetical protein